MVYSFADVPRSTDLKYAPCFDHYACANLIVFLDYTNASAGGTVVRFIKHPASASDAQDILFNPGGPGSSDVDVILRGTAMLRGTIGYKYNLVGFDPRGVNNSDISLDCFPGAPAVRDFYEEQTLQPVLPGNNLSLAESLSRAEGFGKWCTNTHSKEGLAGYANTPAVAADMLHYAKLLAGSATSDEDVKLNYFGVSYGSILGNTFAALYPQHVGKFIIDAVVDAEDYYGGLWENNIEETDDCVQSFFQYCFDAKSNCSFYLNDSSVDALKQRFDAIIANVSEDPISVSNSAIVDYPTIVTVGHINSWIMVAMYAVVRRFPILARVMAELETRNATTMAAGLELGKAPESSCDSGSPLYGSTQAKVLISCNDANGRYLIEDVEQWSEHVGSQVAMSACTGEIWAPSNSVLCRTYDIRPPKSQVFNGFAKGTMTATPMLLVKNKLDNVTPHAHKMAGSVVLEQDAVGHGFNVVESKCTTGYIQRYLETGEMPPKGTFCKAETVLFLAGQEAAKRLARRGSCWM